MDKLIEEARKFVEEECKKPTSKYGYEPYLYHFVFVHKYAKLLADKMDLNEDSREIVEIAAWLHDIGSIMEGRENHHITGAKIAEKKLRELNYSEEKIQLIKKCILNHRGSVNNVKESIEEQIVADADSMSNFDNVSGIFQAALVFEKKNQKEAQDSVRKKLVNCWNKLSLDESKELLKDKYDAIMTLLT